MLVPKGCAAAAITVDDAILTQENKLAHKFNPPKFESAKAAVWRELEPIRRMATEKRPPLERQQDNECNQCRDPNCGLYGCMKRPS